MRRIVVCLVLVTWARVAHASEPARLEVPFEMFRLPNGLTVIVHEDHRAPLVAVNTWYHVGSARETPGRTGFAHLFEHIMFNGSGHVPQGAFDRWLEAVGGDNNGSTTTDRTNYYEELPSNAVETALFLESDRMGWLLDTMSPARVDQQRDVVKNERRQTYENRPYGLAPILLHEALFPPDHPYHWPTIGSMDDLTAATQEDVAGFFRRWYGPANTSVVIAGDVKSADAKALVEKWFGDVPRSEPVPPLSPRPVLLTKETRLVHEDHVELPRLYVSWVTPPEFAPGDAELDALAGVLASGKNSRLYKRLVYELQLAQDVSAGQDSNALASTFDVVVTAREGQALPRILSIVDEEIAKLRASPPSQRELDRFRNQLEAGFYDRLEELGGVADQLNHYYAAADNPGWFEADLARTRALAPRDLRVAAFVHLGPGRVVLSVVPQGKRELAVPAASPAEAMKAVAR